MAQIGSTPNRMTLVDSNGMEVVFGNAAMTSRGTLDATGSATVTFSPAFASEPGVTVVSVGAKASGKPVPDFDVAFTRDVDGNYTGCAVYGERARALPALSGILLIGPLITALSGFQATEPAAGAGFSLVAVKSTVV